MQIVEAHEHLLCDPPYQWNGDALVVIALHDLKQIHTEYLKDHHEMHPIRTIVLKGVEEHNIMTMLTYGTLF